MSSYRMDINGVIGLSDYSNIYDYIGVVENKDSFTITMDNEAQDSISIICSMLQDNNFIIREQGIDSMGKYFINAYRSK